MRVRFGVRIRAFLVAGGAPVASIAVAVAVSAAETVTAA